MAVPGLQRLIYTLLLHALLPVVLVRLLWQGWRIPAYRRRWWERLGLVSRRRLSQDLICIHAVSVGEVLSCGPLIERLRIQYPGVRFLVTTMTPTGADMVEARLDDDVEHLYFPYDLPWAVTAFLTRVRPVMVLVMETEIWPNFYAHCRNFGIPLALLNARISPRSFAGYRRMSALTRAALECVDIVAAQTEEDAARFRTLGVPDGHLNVCGNIKFDIRITSSVPEQGHALRRMFSGARQIVIAASTHAGEEQVVLDAFALILKQRPSCLLILAPRHPERFQSVADLCAAAGLAVVRRSQNPSEPGSAQVFLLDSLGELLQFYACADVAFVGGSIVPAGGHNLLEPAALGLPLLTGPYMFNFREIMGMFATVGAVRVVEDAATLSGAVLRLLDDGNLRHAMGEAARQICVRNRGAAERTVRLLASLPRASA